MIPYLGDFAEDATIYIPLNTFDSNDPAASVTATNLADADIKVHKDGGLTQIVTDGATVAIDFDSITGGHLITIDTSAHADYSTGSDYLVRIEGVTVDGGTINAWIGQFSIENRFMRGTDSANTTTPPTAAAVRAEMDSNSTQLAAIVADTNEIQTDWANGGRLDLILDARANQTSVDTIDSNVDTILVDTATTIPAQISALNDIAATDIVSGGAIDTTGGAVDSVTLVATTTTNSDMRGTDGANTTAPDNSSITAIKAKTDNLAFTKSNEIDANVQSINNETLTGDGAGTPFDVA